MLDSYSDHEKVATIYQSFTLRGNLEGTFGSACYPSPGDRNTVLVMLRNGPAVTVRRQGDLWSVKSDQYEGLDADLEEAARLALNP